MIHTEEKPCKCGYCDKEFKSKQEFVVQVNIHTDENPYKCEHCSYTCRSKSILFQHMRVHTGKEHTIV